MRLETSIELTHGKEAPTLEQKRDLLFSKHKELLGKDRIFVKIFKSLNNGWANLSDKKKEEILKRLEELIEKLIDYHDSYINLKSIPQTRFYREDVQKIQEAVKNADRREKILHDSFGDSINILSRAMKAVRLDNSWRGDELIYSIVPEAGREKIKLWMFRIFGEKIPQAIKR